MKSIFLILTLGACGWSKGDIARQAAFSTITAVDAYQTVEITRNCNEINPIIGKCGGRVPLAPYFVTAILGHAILMHVLPDEYRSDAQWLSIGVEGSTVFRNWRLD